MYEPFFQLKQRPFLGGPVASRYFPATVIEQARQSLMRCVQRAQGTGLLIGPTGTGKTLLCNVLAQQFRASHRVVLLAGAKLCTRRALLQTILFELGLPYRDMSEGELRLALMSRLDPQADQTAGLLLIVDEADTLPMRLFEELRMLTNIVRDGLARVQLILSGAPALEELFTNPKFESFSQRIATRCCLRPFTRDETFRFISWQIETAGGNTNFVFDRSAVIATHETTAGIPRLINQVCDYALHAAAAASQRPLSAKNISLAWSELQQLPSPWSAHATPSAVEAQVAAPSMIEFRSLEELPTLADSHLSAFDFNASPSLIDYVDESSSVTMEPVSAMEQGDRVDQISAVSSAVMEPQSTVVSVTDDVAPPAEVPLMIGEQIIEADIQGGSVVVDEIPSQDALESATSESTIGADFTHDIADLESLVCLAVVGNDPPWQVIPLAESGADTADEIADETTAEPVMRDVVPFERVAFEPSVPEPVLVEPELRIVRDDEPEPVVPNLPPAEERRRRFRQLFSRLRRRASA